MKIEITFNHDVSEDEIYDFKKYLEDLDAVKDVILIKDCDKCVLSCKKVKRLK